ncbi:MAG: helix-turn-helix domain-containing protein [Gemmataceae bacterium]
MAQSEDNLIQEEIMVSEELALVLQRLNSIESTLAELVRQRTVKDWYGTDEVAQMLGKAEFTVREWCRLGRIQAQKRESGRGKYQSWVISNAELQRIQREGLLPIERTAR